MEIDLLTFEETAAIFHKSKKGITNWLYQGILPRSLTVKLGRQVFFSKSKLHEFIEAKLQQS